MSRTRGRVAYDTAAAECILARYGRCLKDVKSDGACLFRALADQIHGTEGLAQEVRDACCDEILADAELRYSIEGDVDVYVRKMRKSETWGGELEIAAAVRRFDICLVVVDPATAKSIPYVPVGKHPQKNVCIVVWRGANGETKHYSSSHPVFPPHGRR